MSKNHMRCHELFLAWSHPITLEQLQSSSSCSSVHVLDPCHQVDWAGFVCVVGREVQILLGICAPGLGAAEGLWEGCCFTWVLADQKGRWVFSSVAQKPEEALLIAS